MERPPAPTSPGFAQSGSRPFLVAFPRTTAQAEALQNLLQAEGVSLTGVIHYVLSPDQIIARLSGRRTCLKCHAVYHLTSHPPQIEGRCDRCGQQLCQREDDNPETIRTRLKCYEESVAPMLDFYRVQGLLFSIEATTPQETFQHTLTALLNLPTRRTSVAG
jgi:adenylate kinase